MFFEFIGFIGLLSNFSHPSTLQTANPPITLVSPSNPFYFPADRRVSLNLSSFAVVTDDHPSLIKDHRDLAVSLGTCQHSFHLRLVRQYIMILNISTLPLKSFPSFGGIGSGVFPKNDDLF